VAPRAAESLVTFKSGTVTVVLAFMLTVAGCTASGNSSVSHGPRHSVSIHKPRHHHRHKRPHRPHRSGDRREKPGHHRDKPGHHRHPRLGEPHNKPARRAPRRTHSRTLVARRLPPALPARDVPRRSLTPGVVLTTNTARVCVSGYSARVRDVPSSESEAAYARYGVPHIPYKHEVDHLISLELGGSNSMRNLWPEPYAGRWGARTKDVLENKLHELVCSGALSLPRAQHMEATNWIAAYKKYIGAAPAPQPAPKPSREPRPTRPAPISGSCEPGYSPCLPVTSDLNCDDLSSAQTPVRVTGSDPYGLDADGDGYGCDS
jgi:hypothetical protein